MTVAFTFPGQGSQTVRMGRELADAFPEARAVFAEVDDALGEPLSRLIWDGPQDELTLTANAQPALMAVSLAAMRAMEAQGLDVAGKVAFMAGHSLGEYSALAASGMLSIADAARLLRIRGHAMQDAVPAGEGAMAAILGLEEGAVESACTDAAQGGGTCQIANDNGGGQLVISGSRAAVERAMALCTERGAKRALPLPVSAPFHSALMAPAANAMREALSAVAKNRLTVPIVSNVLVQPLRDPDAIVASLVEQVTGRVRWRETVEWFSANGVTTLVEVGAGKVLSGLARRIDRNINVLAMNGPADIDAVLTAIG